MGVEILIWAVIVSVLADASASPLHAQGGFPTYPYCAQYSDGTSLDCSFATLSMCYQSVTGVGGVCIDNPRAGGVVAARPVVLPYAFAPSPVPPPPAKSSAQQSQSPPQLPGPLPQQAQAPLPPPPPCNPLFDGTYCASAANNSITSIQSPSSDLMGGAEPPATLGEVTFSGNTDCIGILRQMSCGGS